MQGTMDIVAVMQQSNVTKKKSNVQDFGRNSVGSSFKRELAEARSNTDQRLRQEAGDVRRQDTEAIDNKAEKFAKIMSKGKLQTENLQNASKEEVQQTKEPTETVDAKEATTAEEVKADSLKNDAKEEGKVETETELAELIKSAETLIQELMKLLSADAGETTNQDIEKTTEALKAISEKLEQMLSQSIDLKTSTSGDVLPDLKVEIKELVKQLKTEMKDIQQTEVTTARDLQQKVNTLQHLINRMNAIKPVMQKKLEDTAVKPEIEVKTAEAASAQTKVSEKVEPSMGKAEAEVGKAELKPIAETDTKQSDSKDNKKDDHKDSAYKTAKGTQEHSSTVDKPQKGNLKDFIPLQNENTTFQMNLKELNLNVKKEALVSINKSEIVNQVVKKADIILREGHSEMIMKLEPESLGKLNLKIMVENGLVTAKFIAESQQVKEVLESSFNQLKDALQEKGISVQNFSVSVGQQAGDSSQSQSFYQWKQTIKMKNKSIGEFMELEGMTAISDNPYNYHEGRFDYKA